MLTASTLRSPVASHAGDAPSLHDSSKLHCNMSRAVYLFNLGGLKEFGWARGLVLHRRRGLEKLRFHVCMCLVRVFLLLCYGSTVRVCNLAHLLLTPLHAEALLIKSAEIAFIRLESSD